MKLQAGVLVFLLGAICAGGQMRFKSVTVTHLQTCAIDQTGTLYCWFENRGALSGTVPTPVLPQLKFRDVSLNSEEEGCAVTLNGETYCWPKDGKPAQVPGTLRFVSVSQGTDFACGLTADGAAWCWGRAPLLGDGLGKDSAQPVAVAGGLTFASISAGNFHTCGLTKDGALWCWGNFVNGKVPVHMQTDAALQQVAPSGGGMATAADGSVYVFDWAEGRVKKADTIGTFSSVDSGGEGFACGLRDGKAYCWGKNDDGQLGTGGDLHSNKPIAVHGGRNFTALRLSRPGGTRACGLMASGELYCWGESTWIPRLVTSTLPPEDPKEKAAPLATNKAVADPERANGLVAMVEGDRSGAGLVFYAGLDRAYIVTAYHVVRPDAGQTGRIQVRFRTAPARALDARLTDSDTGLDVAVLRVDGLQQAGIDEALFPFESVRFNGFEKAEPVHIIGNPGARRWGGTLHPDHFLEVQHSKLYFESSFIRPGYSGGGLFDESWLLAGMIVGDDAPEGQAIGVATLSERLSQWRYPVMWGSPADAPDFVSLGRLEDRHFGVTADGRTYVWGRIWKDEPEGMRLVERLRVRTMSGPCGLTTAGQAFCWEQIDEGDQEKILITGETAIPAAAGLVFDQIADRCAITHEGKAYCWGHKRGDGVPRFDDGLALEPCGNLVLQSIAGDGGHMCALTRDGAAYCWGNGGDGQLGHGEVGDYSIPVDVPGNLRFQSIYSGFGDSCGISTDGKTYCWGANDHAQLARPGGKRSTIPSEIEGVPRLVTLAISDDHICGIAEDQRLWCWGSAYGAAPLKLPLGVHFHSLQSAYWHEAADGHFGETCGLTVEGPIYCWNPGADPEPSPSQAFRAKLSRIDMYQRDGDYAKAERAAKDTLNQFPNVPEVLERYGDLMADLGRVDQVQQALRTLQQMASAEPPSHDDKDHRKALQRSQWIYVAHLQRRLHNLDAALAALDSAEKLSESNEVDSLRMERAITYSNLGRRKEAIDEYRAMLRANPDDAGVENDLAYELAQDGKSLEEALDLAQRSLDDAPENIDRLDTAAYVLLRMGKLDEGARMLERARANGAERDVDILEHSGDLCAKQGKAAEAQRNWQGALAEWNKLPAGARDASAVARLTGNLAKN